MNGGRVSVKLCDRSDSKTQFLEELRKLNVRIGQIVVNGPRKYAASHGDHLVRCALEAYKHAQIANKTNYQRGRNVEQAYRIRREHFNEARGLVEHIGSAAKVYFDLMENIDGGGKDKKKASGRMEDVGMMCNKIIGMLSAVMKSDTERYREYTR